MQAADREGNLEKHFCPNIQPDGRKIAEIEGWILGVLKPAKLRIEFLEYSPCLDNEGLTQFRS